MNKYRSIRTGPDQSSMAFTYAWLAAARVDGSFIDADSSTVDEPEFDEE